MIDDEALSSSFFPLRLFMYSRIDVLAEGEPGTRGK